MLGKNKRLATEPDTRLELFSYATDVEACGSSPKFMTIKSLSIHVFEPVASFLNSKMLIVVSKDFWLKYILYQAFPLSYIVSNL